MANFNLTVTNEGAAFLANVIANQGSIDFTEVRFSSTNYVGSEATLTEGTFGGTFITAVPSASVADLTTINVESSFDNSTFTTDKTLYSIGLIAEDGDGNVALVAVCTTSTPDTIPKFISVALTFTYNINLTVSDTQNITVTASGAGVVFVTDIVDDLTSENTNKPLSAKQGKVLKGNVDYLYNNTGGKNLLKNQAVSTAVNAVTFTIYGDGTFKIYGTASNDIYFKLFETTDPTEYASYLGKTVILSGTPAALKDADTRLYAEMNGTKILDEYAFPSATMPAFDTKFNVYLKIKSGQSVDCIIEPMIRDASISDDTYVPYAMTNRELTERVLQNDSVSVIADGVKNYATLLNSLYSQVSTDKIGPSSYILIDDASTNYYYLRLQGFYSTYYAFTSAFVSSDGENIRQCALSSSSAFYNSHSNTRYDISSQVPTSGTEISLYY